EDDELPAAGALDLGVDGEDAQRQDVELPGGSRPLGRRRLAEAAAREPVEQAPARRQELARDRVGEAGHAGQTLVGPGARPRHGGCSRGGALVVQAGYSTSVASRAASAAAKPRRPRPSRMWSSPKSKTVDGTTMTLAARTARSQNSAAPPAVRRANAIGPAAG